MVSNSKFIIRSSKEQDMKARHLSVFCIVLFGLLALVSLAGEAGAKIPGSRAKAGAPSGSPKYEVPSIVPGDWPMYGRDVSRTNFNPDETTISSGTVNQL